MAFQKKKIDNIHPQALQQIKDVVEGKTPAHAGFGGKTPDVSGFTKLALDQIKSVVGGGGGSSIKGVFTHTADMETGDETYTRLEPTFMPDAPEFGECYYCQLQGEYDAVIATYSGDEPSSDMASLPDLAVSIGIGFSMIMLNNYDDGEHGPHLLLIM